MWSPLGSAHALNAEGIHHWKQHASDAGWQAEETESIGEASKDRTKIWQVTVTTVGESLPAITIRSMGQWIDTSTVGPSNPSCGLAQNGTSNSHSPRSTDYSSRSTVRYTE
jgi:hypothetical protein